MGGGREDGVNKERENLLKRIRKNPPKYTKNHFAPRKLAGRQYHLYKDSKLLQTNPPKKHVSKTCFSEEWEIYLYRTAYRELRKKAERLEMQDDTIQEVDNAIIKQNVEEYSPWVSKLQPYVEFVETTYTSGGEKKQCVQKFQKCSDSMIIGFEHLDAEDQKLIQQAEQQLEKGEISESEMFEEVVEGGRSSYPIVLPTIWNGKHLLNGYHRVWNHASNRKKKEIKYMTGVLLFHKYMIADNVPCIWLRHLSNGRGMLLTVEYFTKVILSNSTFVHQIQVLFENEWIYFAEFLQQLGCGHESALRDRSKLLHPFVKEIRKLNYLEHQKNFEEKKFATQEEIEMLKAMEGEMGGLHPPAKQ
eukprot:TRINITY_DN2481_c0_g2_i2.p2 TRINITY_DN2481_c0_g2~~TRINITY_DN2481_c0_g2_i2.p2  ORF type:complete len:360 (+),score=48.47 TRINITY_DN2481_c0_g2_i2:199-1278(+)